MDFERFLRDTLEMAKEAGDKKRQHAITLQELTDKNLLDRQRLANQSRERIQEQADRAAMERTRADNNKSKMLAKIGLLDLYTPSSIQNAFSGAANNPNLTELMELPSRKNSLDSLRSLYVDQANRLNELKSIALDPEVSEAERKKAAAEHKGLHSQFQLLDRLLTKPQGLSGDEIGQLMESAQMQWINLGKEGQKGYKSYNDFEKRYFESAKKLRQPSRLSDFLQLSGIENNPSAIPPVIPTDDKNSFEHYLNPPPGSGGAPPPKTPSNLQKAPAAKAPAKRIIGPADYSRRPLPITRLKDLLSKSREKFKEHRKLHTIVR